MVHVPTTMLMNVAWSFKNHTITVCDRAM